MISLKNRNRIPQESNMRYALKLDDNYYELLNISADASMSEVRQAYELALQTFQEDSLASYSLFSKEESDQILRKISAAYMVLIDPFTRKEYDHSSGLIPIETNPSPKSEIVAPYSKKSVEERTKKPITENNFPSSKERTVIKPAWKPCNSRVSNPAVEKPSPVLESQPFTKSSLIIPTEARVNSLKKRKETSKTSLKNQKSNELDREKNRKQITQKNKNSQSEVQKFLNCIQTYTGDVLRQIREKKQISVLEVAQELCIREFYIHAIEEELFEEQPSIVYVKGYLASYARCLELPAEKIVVDYTERYHAWKNSAKR